ncbi:MAG: hypothetical protein ACOYNI_06415 [Acidimicrobiia bacterium]
MDAIKWVHFHWGWYVLGLNAIAGIATLVTYWVKGARGRWTWILTGIAEVGMLVQIVLGVILVTLSKDYQGNSRVQFHMFYGFVSFVTIGLLFAYRKSMRGRLELFYGLGGCFLAGLAIRAIMQVV